LGIAVVGATGFPLLGTGAVVVVARVVAGAVAVVTAVGGICDWWFSLAQPATT
jgi:hypothetical protein